MSSGPREAVAAVAEITDHVAFYADRAQVTVEQDERDPAPDHSA